MRLSSCRNLVLAAAVSAAIGLSASAADPVAPAKPATQPTTAPVAASQPAAPTVVTINGKAISALELDRETHGVQMQAAKQLPPEAIAQMMPQMRQQAMSNLVSKHLLLLALVDRKIKVTDEEIQKSIDDVMKNVPPGESLDEALKHAGITRQDFTQQITDNLGIEKIIAEETKNVTATDADLAKFYAENPKEFEGHETVSARHILVKFDDGDDDAKKALKKKKADAIRERLVKGEDFVKLCAENSDDPGSKNNGGLYENFPRGQMVPPFENAAFTQKIGEIGPLVETSFGYHIIKVEKHAAPTPIPLAEVKDKLKPYLERKSKQEAVQKYIKTLHDAAKITYADGFGPPAPVPTTSPATAPSSAPSTPKK